MQKFLTETTTYDLQLREVMYACDSELKDRKWWHINQRILWHTAWNLVWQPTCKVTVMTRCEYEEFR